MKNFSVNLLKIGLFLVLGICMLSIGSQVKAIQVDNQDYRELGDTQREKIYFFNRRSEDPHSFEKSKYNLYLNNGEIEIFTNKTSESKEVVKIVSNDVPFEYKTKTDDNGKVFQQLIVKKDAALTNEGDMKGKWYYIWALGPDGVDGSSDDTWIQLCVIDVELLFYHKGTDNEVDKDSVGNYILKPNETYDLKIKYNSEDNIFPINHWNGVLDHEKPNTAYSYLYDMTTVYEGTSKETDATNNYSNQKNPDSEIEGIYSVDYEEGTFTTGDTEIDFTFGVDRIRAYINPNRPNYDPSLSSIYCTANVKIVKEDMTGGTLIGKLLGLVKTTFNLGKELFNVLAGGEQSGNLLGALTQSFAGIFGQGTSGETGILGMGSALMNGFGQMANMVLGEGNFISECIGVFGKIFK